MTADWLMSLLAALVTLIAGGIAATDGIARLVRALRRQKAPSKSYSERLAELTASLTKASAAVDALLSELASVARDPENAVASLEAGLAQMEKKEMEMRERIAMLQNVPLPVAEHFARLVEPTARRNARRDYFLFGAGVIVTTIITIGMQFIIGP